MYLVVFLHTGTVNIADMLSRDETRYLIFCLLFPLHQKHSGLGEMSQFCFRFMQECWQIFKATFMANQLKPFGTSWCWDGKLPEHLQIKVHVGKELTCLPHCLTVCWSACLFCLSCLGVYPSLCLFSHIAFFLAFILSHTSAIVCVHINISWS